MTVAKRLASNGLPEARSNSLVRPGTSLKKSWPLWPAQLFAITLFINFGFSLGDLVLSLPRVLLLICTPFCILSMVRLGRRHWLTADSFMVANAAWIFVSFCVNHGLQRAVISGGIYSVEMICPYLLARLCITDPQRFAKFAKLITWMAITLLLVTVPECFTSFNVFRAAAGEPQPPPMGLRMNLHRAYGPFPHPILCGIFCSTAFAFSWYVVRPRGIWVRSARGVAIFVSTATSLASGALLSVFVQCLIIGWDGATRKVPRRWLILTALLAAGYITVGLISNRDAFSAVISYITLNPGTAYTRITIWEYGSAEVLRHPIFGIGMNDWTRPVWLSNSVDNYWLATAMRFGFPGVITVVGVMAWLFIRLMLQDDPSGKIRSSRMAWVSIMLGVAMAAGTVHIWSNAADYVSFFLGTAGWMIGQERYKSRANSWPA